MFGQLLSLVICSLLVLPSSTLALVVNRAVSGFPDPLVDSFYSQPDNISSYSLGQIIAQRSTVSTFTGASTNLYKSYQLKFRSQNSQDEPIAAITTVLVPKTKTLTGGVPNMLSFQNFEDSVSFSCSPSWAYVANSGSQAALLANLEAPIVNGWALNQGYYVVIPDHEGPTSSFIAGRNAGHIVLDSIRAAIKAESLSSKTRIGMYGYSGGANAGVFASSLAPGYAPELNVVGVSLGGTPVSPKDTFYFLNGGGASGLAGAGAVGLASAHPEAKAYLDSILTAEGNATFAKLTADGTCVNTVTSSEFSNVNYFDLVSPKQDFLGAAPISKALALETVIQAEASYTVPVPTHPVLMYHALTDELVPFNSSQAYVDEQCKKGADIRRVIFLLGEHITTEILGIPSALDFLGKAFAGTLSNVICGTTIPKIDLGTSASTKIVGSANDKALQSQASAASS
ncbi:putative lipase precursor [Microstroma glucosiphilum]|uniref:triacylglycerol lipase n=1 Tax=Pseudomicrostroma glucosiphilum TaxID=1684307 RepID=A0A316U942_9BASI|nr:putative lipase precursor [Pseudomicrostroma glucosiphilum]PWN21692.1 putative lipase precursor [Pseudomicrostroma glucosiphilum]